MEKAIQTALSNYLLAMADDELILGHRDSEWCGQAPILEEDIAFANLSLDEIGHAKIWYELAAEILGLDPETYPDHMIFQRAADEFRCIQLVELPIGDWAFSMLRQYLFDVAEVIRLQQLSHSGYAPLAEAARRVLNEELYHFRHTHAWIKRLGLGTPESQTRMQQAMQALWPYSGQLFAPLEDEILLVERNIVSDPFGLKAKWGAHVTQYLAECGLNSPVEQPQATSRRQHTPYLKPLVLEMQSVFRLEPEADW